MLGMRMGRAVVVLMLLSGCLEQEAKKPEEAESKWRFAEETRFHARENVIELTSEDGFSTLQFTCNNERRALWPRLFPGSNVASRDGGRVIFRVDKEPPFTERWVLTARGAFAGSEPTKLYERVRNANSLSVRIAHDRGDFDMTFDVSNGAKRYDELLAKCKAEGR